MVAGDITSIIPFTVPEAVPTVKGVLRGFPNVKVESCDTKGTPAGFIGCEQKAVTEHVAAVVLSYNAGGAAGQAILAKAGIPAVGESDSTSADSFAVSSATAEFVGIGVGLGKVGNCTKLGTLFIDGTPFLADNIKAGIESVGGKEVARAAVAANAADLAPAVAKITESGAQCVALSLAPAGAAQALTALKQSGKKLVEGSVSAVFTKQVLDSLGPSLTNGLVVVDQQLNGGDDSPGIAAVKADVASEDSSAPITQIGIISWVAAKLIANALPKVQGDVTSTSLTTALNGLRNVDLDGVVHNWSSIELANPAYKRLFNHYGITYTIENGKAIKQGDFYDLATTAALSGKSTP